MDKFTPWKIENGTLQLLPWEQGAGDVLVTVDVFDDWHGPVADSAGSLLHRSTAGWCSTGEFDPKRAVRIADVLQAFFAHIDANPQATFHLRTLHPERVRECWPEREFVDDYPVLGSKGSQCFPSILLAPHDARAQSNHGRQTLQRLKERGGLGMCEMVAILEDRQWEPMTEEDARERLVQIRKAAASHRPNITLSLGPLATQADADQRLPVLLDLASLCREVYPVFRPVERIDMGMSVATCNCCERWPSRWVRLPIPVSGDWPVGHTTIAPAGVYRAKSNRHGALSVEAADGKMLGIRPEEFECLGGISRIVVSGENNDYTRDLRSQAIDAGVAFEHNWESEVEA